MDGPALLVDAFDRVRALVHDVVDGLSSEELTFRIDAEANTVAWLVWHLTRIQDDHIAAAASSEQVWTSGGWDERFGLPFDPRATGYGHSAHDVAAVRVASGVLLIDYHDAVHARTIEFVRSLRDGDLDRIVDRSFDPPVSLGVRLVSVVADDLEHVGQAALVRGIARRR